MSVSHVEQYQLDQVWPQVEGWLHKALETGHGELNVSQLRMMVAKGMADLFISVENEKITAAVVTEWSNFPNYRAANVIAIGGRGVIKHWDEFKDWLRLGGASYVIGHCHESVSRLWGSKLGMEKTYTIMRAAL